jgi:hypothetical protein
MSKTATRNEYEQLEYQRKNPHLFTTMSQSVGADGTLVTYQQVTSNLQYSVDKMQEAHTKKFGGVHPVYCMRPLIGKPEHPMCQAIEMCNEDMDRCKTSFVENYKYMHDRVTS